MTFNAVKKGTIFLPYFALALSIFLVFTVGVTGGFIFDSLSALDNNPYINNFPATFSDWYLAALSFEGSQFRRPISLLTFQINNLIAGDVNHWSTKLTNIVIHVCNTWLIYAVFKQGLDTPFFKEAKHKFRLLPFYVALFWAINPLHVSTVLYAVQRMTQLAALFSFLSILYYIRFRLRLIEEGGLPERRKACLSQIVLQLFLFLLAILSKENALILPGLLLLVEWFFFQRFSFSNRALIFLIFSGLLFAVLITLYYWFTSDFELRYLQAGREFTAGERLLTQVGLLLRYIVWFVFPNIRSLGMYHDDINIVTSWTSISFLLPMLVWVTLLVSGFAFRRTSFGAVCLFGLLWYLIAHALESSIWPLEMVFEHRNYLPIVGVAFLVVFLTMSALNKINFSDSEKVLRLICVLLFIPFIGVGFVRSYDWSNQYGLAFLHAKNHPHSVRSQYHFALENRLLLGKLGAESEGFDQIKTYAYEYTRKVIEMEPKGLVGWSTLYLLDGKWNPSHVDHEYYRSKIRETASNMKSSATNINSIGLIKACVVRDICQYTEEQFSELIKIVERQTYGRVVYEKVMAGFSHRVKEDRKKAIRYFEAYLLDHPDDIKSRRYLAKLSFQEGETAEAYKYLFYNLKVDQLGLERVHLSKWVSVE